MREQVAEERGERLVRKSVLGSAVVARLMVLEAVALFAIAEAEEEVIAVVVAGGVHRAGLVHEFGE